MHAGSETTVSLYDPALLEAARRSARFGRNPGASHRGRGLNALCGDKVTIELDVVADVVQRYTFRATGCVICIGSAALLGELVEGQTQTVASALASEFRADLAANRIPASALLAPLSQVVEFPSRKGCADLAPATFLAALDAQSATVSTE